MGRSAYGFISIHVPAWGTTSRKIIFKIFFTFQSTFPRGERLLFFFCARMSPLISIHVPAWGTTKIEELKENGIAISIHVPAWGTTVKVTHTLTFRHDFNPRSRVGNDFSYCHVTPLLFLFQSTFPRGERLASAFNHHTNNQFQSTFPRGERHKKKTGEFYFLCISIHVPAWGTTPFLGVLSLLICISIHVPAWGTTIQCLQGFRGFIISIHVPAWGTTFTAVM